MGATLVAAVGILAIAATIWRARAPQSAAAPGQVQRASNALAGSPSPYLRMHADNPVDWYPWGPEALELARSQDKPIFLSIGYSTCYWCHVMADESFADPLVGALLAQHFVSIKVDRELRPDLDDLYMTAVQAIAGRGGWPLTVILTPDLKPFWGGTYMPRDQLLNLLQTVGDAWRSSRDELQARAEHVATIVAGSVHPGSPAEQVPGPQLLSAAVDELARHFDPVHGGFGPGPKFPQPARLQLLLEYVRQTGDADTVRFLALTLDRMDQGGIHDHVGGGFHRYATDDRWIMPHFEKMLYDNAQLLDVYARATELSGNPVYAAVAADIAQWMMSTMSAADGTFYSAIDSATGGIEGQYYTWTTGELDAALNPMQLAAVTEDFGLDERAADLDGRTVLFRSRPVTQAAAARGLTVSQYQTVWSTIRNVLSDARAARPEPFVDRKRITAWNSLAAASLASAGQALDQPEWTAAAAMAMNALLAQAVTPDGLSRIATDGKQRLPAMLDDYAATILALVELHDAGPDTGPWLDGAAQVADLMIGELWDPVGGGFYYAPPEHDRLLFRGKDSRDGALPSGNSLAARALTRLAAAGESKYAPYAAAIFRVFAQRLQADPRDHPYMILALAQYHHAELPLDGPMPSIPEIAASTTQVVAGTAAWDATLDQWIIQIVVRDGWHLNANPAGLDFLVPTAVAASRDGRPLAIQPDYPQGNAITLGASGHVIPVYSGTFPIMTALQDPDAAGLEFALRAQACNDRGQCLQPTTSLIPLATP